VVIFLLHPNEFALHPNFIIGLCLANIKGTKMLNEVIITHPECSIVFIKLRVQQLLNIWSPEGTSSAPCTIPLEVSPEIPDVNQLMVIHFFNLHNTVSVTLLKLVCLLLWIVLLVLLNNSRGRCCKKIAFLIES
jgi:hypothetical protein